MVSLEQTLKMLKISILDDGKVSLGETTLLLRALQPFITQGSGVACEIRDLLLRVRKDGVVTQEESEHIARLLTKIVEGTFDLRRYIFTVQNQTKDGARYYDFSRLTDTPWLFQKTLSLIEETLVDIPFDLIVVPNSRAFAIGGALAAHHGCGFVPVAPRATLPREVIRVDEWEMHQDAVMAHERVVIFDEVLSSGRTARACADLVRQVGGTVVKMVFVAEREKFQAREKVLKGFDVSSLVKYAPALDC